MRLHSVVYWVGLVSGFGVALVLATVYVFLGGPLQEWFLERFVDPLRGSREDPGLSPRPAGMQGVLVSDLHIDTWQFPADGSLDARTAAFLEFLKTVKSSPHVDSFYLNGDLMDIPLHPVSHPGEPVTLDLPLGPGQELGVLLARYDQILENLLMLTVRAQDGGIIRRALFQTGNHDIGISGLRYVRPEMPAFLPSVQTVWNPSLVIQKDVLGKHCENAVYIEHGHLRDPLLWLYMRYALLDIMRSGHQHRERHMMASMQRQGKVGMGNQVPVPAHRAKPAPEPGESLFHFEEDARGLATTLVRLRYRQAARRTFNEFKRYRKHHIRTVIFGHTHLPDRYVFPGGQVYINSGDWSGNTDHRAYCVLDPDGVVRGPFQWESPEKAEFARA